MNLFGKKGEETKEAAMYACNRNAVEMESDSIAEGFGFGSDEDVFSMGKGIKTTEWRTCSRSLDSKGGVS